MGRGGRLSWVRLVRSCLGGVTIVPTACTLSNSSGFTGKDTVPYQFPQPPSQLPTVSEPSSWPEFHE